MPDSLRSRCIEAGARAAYEADVARMVAAAAPKLILLPVAWAGTTARRYGLRTANRRVIEHALAVLRNPE